MERPVALVTDQHFLYRHHKLQGMIQLARLGPHQTAVHIPITFQYIYKFLLPRAIDYKYKVLILKAISFCCTKILRNVR